MSRLVSRVWRWEFCLCGIVLGMAIVQGDEVRVPGWARLIAERPAAAGSAEAGRMLLQELQCASCHAADPAAGLGDRPAPRLDEVGKRVRPEFLRQFLTDPSHADPGTTMPRLLTGTQGTDRERQIESLVHFLASTGSFQESPPFAAGVATGRKLFHSVGCTACHDPQDPMAASLPTSVPLAGAMSKYSVRTLAQFLQDPLQVRPAGRMPHLSLTAEEARDIACYLLRDQRAPVLLTYDYYEGSWEKLPDFSQLTPRSQGEAAGFDVNLGAPDRFAVRFQGKFRVAKEGNYRFTVRADDGARLTINGNVVVDHDGIHPPSEKEGKIFLAAGEHQVLVEYFEAGGGEVLEIDYQGQGIKRQSLEYALLPRGGGDPPRPLAIDAELVRAGRQLFEQTGCGSCHALRIDGQPVAGRPATRKLSELRRGGCIAAVPQPGTPHFPLSDQQRSSLEKALASQGEQLAASRSSESEIAHWMGTLQCFACHQRGERGGVEAARNSYYLTDQPEMGDEGRLPPPLPGVGGKLRHEYLRKIIRDGAKDRPYMRTRMPRFGPDHAERLAGLLRQADALPEAPAPQLELAGRHLQAVGRQLVGERGLSCVKCHTWGKLKASGIQAISLTTMTRRLEPTWFRQYLLNPQQFRPGTRMPAAWPNGQSPFADILGGDAARQIQAVWEFLAAGEDAAVPLGVGEQAIVLQPTTEPVLYRNFLEGAGPRGIGVGYPEQVHLAYDADQCRLAVTWQGAFIDAAKHWVGRGPGFQRPLGDHLLSFPNGTPWAVLDSLATNWPTDSPPAASVRFRGYRLDERRRPTFLSQWQDRAIEDYFDPQPLGKLAELRRTIRVNGPGPDGWLRLLAVERLDAEADHWFRVDRDWRIRVQSTGGIPVTRTASGKQELLVPIVTTADRGLEIKIQMVW